MERRRLRKPKLAGGVGVECGLCWCGRSGKDGDLPSCAPNTAWDPDSNTLTQTDVFKGNLETENSRGAGVADFDESFDKETTKPDDYADSFNKQY